MIRTIQANENDTIERMTRTKSAYPYYYNPLGGFMAFPPLDCKRSDAVVELDGIRWLCNVVCNRSCEEKSCDRKKQYVKNQEWQREAERLEGIRRERNGDY